MTGTLIFDPLVPLPLLVAIAVLTFAGLALALWRGLVGWPLRTLAALVLLGALAGPVYQQEDRDPLSDIVLLLEDASASQSLSDRPAQTADALEELEGELASRPNTEVRRIPVPDGEGDEGTRLMAALSEARAEEPSARVAGIIALSDGRVHDADLAPDLPAPLHLLMTGRDSDWDRRLIVANAPAFAIIGEPVTLTLRIEDSGAVPDAIGATAPLEISVDGGEPARYDVPVGQDIDLPVTLGHGGNNVIRFSVSTADGELTDRNNTALIQMNGVRDRLRVLLVSGEPHPGGRTWRNLLKSDSSVDLVHFTILRPPEKQDGVPVAELSLIAFPTRELFLEKIDDFDLIIFDRYKRRGILPALYLDNVAQYVARGGAVLVAAGPDFASADSIFRSPLGPVIPAEPTARVLEQRYRPQVTDMGQRHPVTGDLGDPETWGGWLRQIEVTPTSGNTLMSGLDDRPLLVLDRVGEGRVRAEVSVDMDMSRTTKSETTYDPDGQVVLSSNVVEQSANEKTDVGGQVSVSNALPDAGGAGGGAGSNSQTTEETTNFENSKTETVTVQEPGQVTQIRVSVLVDGIRTLDDGGNTTAYQDRDTSEITQLQQLVESAIPYVSNRGDTVVVQSMRFVDPAPLVASDPGFNLFGLNKEDLVDVLSTGGSFVAVILVILLVVRPLVIRVIEAIPDAPPPPDPAQLESSMQETPAIAGPTQITPDIMAAAAEGDEQATALVMAARQQGALSMDQMGTDTRIDVAQVEGRVQESAIKKVANIIKANPDESVSIVRHWLYAE
jgi:hypothetical protein